MVDLVDRPLPPTPPPPTYTIGKVRSRSPEIHTPTADDKVNAVAYSANNVYTPQSNIKPSISMIPADSGETNASNGTVHIHPPEPTSYTQPVHRPPNIQTLTPQQSPYLDPTRLSPSSPSFMPRRRPLNEKDRNLSNPSHRRIVSENSPSGPRPDDVDARTKALRHVSTSIIQPDQAVENFEPLKYHHLAAEDPKVVEINKRASKLTLRTNNSDGSGNSDPNRLEPPLSGSARNSVYGRTLQRPESMSDMRGRTYSPQLSPARPHSRNSRSPDARPLSYVDLLNVPYPQAAPSGAEHLVNSQLRTAVGNNASLLSTRKTLEMYRANVKKTNDPAIQYEFAVFMISAAQEDGLEIENEPRSASVDKSQETTREGLLKEAKHILQKLCDRSYPFAQYYLADGYASGLFNKGREDWDRAFPLFLAASKHGHAEAGYRTALCYEFGWGCRVDGQKAVQFYQQAASKNHPGAMLRLGRACLTGDMGLTKRYREGVRWLMRAAESADYQYNQAPYDLGCLHETGFGPDVFKDESYAAQLFTKAADLGHVEANFRLGEAYEYGQLNCPKDPALSIHFYVGAAESKHAQSQMALCAWYMVGVPNVLEKDENEAYEWAKRAANQGLPKAQYTVGYFTEMGIGCRRDALEANVWYVKAADQGEERAKHRLAAIRAAATGVNPATAAASKKVKPILTDTAGNVGPDSEKKKRFGIF